MSVMLHDLVQIAILASNAVRKSLEGGLVTVDKPGVRGAHFSTQADEKSQEIIIRELARRDPDTLILAEEQTNHSGFPRRFWAVDPTDGTTNLFSGCPMWGVTITLIEDGQPQAGIITLSNNVWVAAQRGQGCRINGTEWKIPPLRAPDKLMIGTDIGSWSDPRVDSALRQKFVIHSLMAAVWGAWEVLKGITAAYYNMNVAKIWDAAAGCLAVQEAGGIACALDGSPLTWNSLDQDWILAANQQMADEIIKVTKFWKGGQRESTPTST